MLRGSHIDVFDGLINLCISVARVNTDSMESEALKKWFHQKWWENARSISIGSFLGCAAERPCFHQPPRHFLSHHQYTTPSLEHQVLFEEITWYPEYTFIAYRSPVRPVEAGRVRISMPNHLSDCRGPPPTELQPSRASFTVLIEPLVRGPSSRSPW